MRTALIPLGVALFATVAMGLAPQRSVIISWPNDTPDEIVEQSKEAIRKAKGEWGCRLLSAWALDGPAIR